MSFLGRVFIDRNVADVPVAELAGELDDELYGLNQRLGKEQFPRSAAEYLDEWAAPEREWLRKLYPPDSDEARLRPLAGGREGAHVGWPTSAAGSSSAPSPGSRRSSTCSDSWSTAQRRTPWGRHPKPNAESWHLQNAHLPHRELCEVAQGRLFHP